MAATRPVDPYKELTFLKNQRLKFSSNAPFAPSYVTSQLTLSPDPTALYATRVKGRQIVLENPARESKWKQELDAKRTKARVAKEKKKLGIIGKREAKERGVWKLDECQMKFDLFVPLHHLWMGYMSELLSLSQPTSSLSALPNAHSMPSSSSMHPKLLKADFHGSIISSIAPDLFDLYDEVDYFFEVRQSRNPCLVGLSGIVIHETENAFKIITVSNKVKVLPKQNSVFSFAVPLYSTLQPAATFTSLPIPASSPASETKMTTVLDYPHIEFELYGNQFRFRSADRAGRKFKHKETIEL